VSKDAVIRVRCSSELKARLTARAKEKEQVLSDFIRVKLIELLDHEDAASNEDMASKSSAAGAPRVVPLRRDKGA
jgi:hypothetical protein